MGLGKQFGRARARLGLGLGEGSGLGRGHQERREEDMHREGVRCAGGALAEEGEGAHRDHLEGAVPHGSA